MPKTICDWSKKDFKNHPDKLHALTVGACLYCRKCGRVANTKKALCSAESFASSGVITKAKFAA